MTVNPGVAKHVWHVNGDPANGGGSGAGDSRRHPGRGEPFDDLVQVASIGLLNADRRYPGSRAIAFTAYAGPMINGELKRHFRDHCWALYVPRATKDCALCVNPAIQRELEHRGVKPAQTQLAERLSLPQGDIVDALQAWSALRTSSFEAPVPFRAEPEPQALAEEPMAGDTAVR